MTSLIEVARGIRKPSLFFSEQYTELFKKNYENFIINFAGKSNLKLANIEN